jgi:hypothetical protein
LSDVILVIISIFLPFPFLNFFLLEYGAGDVETNLVEYKLLLYFIGVELSYSLPLSGDAVSLFPRESSIIALISSNGIVTLPFVKLIFISILISPSLRTKYLSLS